MKTVLLAEDNEDDIFIMKMACKRTGIPHVLQIVTDGDMALDYLSGKGRFADRILHPLPNVIFLDIKMPKRNGHEVLTWIRAHPDFKEFRCDAHGVNFEGRCGSSLSVGRDVLPAKSSQSGGIWAGCPGYSQILAGIKHIPFVTRIARAFVASLTCLE